MVMMTNFEVWFHVLLLAAAVGWMNLFVGETIRKRTLRGFDLYDWAATILSIAVFLDIWRHYMGWD